MPAIVADPIISFLRRRMYRQEYGHHRNYRHSSRNIRNHKSIPQCDKKTPLEPLDAFRDLTTWPVPPGIEIRRWSYHGEPHGAVCNRILLLSKYASSRVVAGACVTACPDLTCCHSETLRKTTNGLDNPDPR